MIKKKSKIWSSFFKCVAAPSVSCKVTFHYFRGQGHGREGSGRGNGSSPEQVQHTVEEEEQLHGEAVRMSGSQNIVISGGFYFLMLECHQSF